MIELELGYSYIINENSFKIRNIVYCLLNVPSLQFCIFRADNFTQ